MAKIDPTSLFTELRGNVGGLVFSRNRSGFFVKRLARSAPSSRPAPRARRDAFAAAAQYWQTHRNDIYEDPMKGDIPVSEWWDDFAVEPGQEKTDIFGGAYAATGYNWFMTFAVLQDMEDKPPLDLPPTDAIPALWPDFTLAFRHTGAGVNTSFSSTTTSTAQTTRPWISARIQYSPGAKPVVPPFFFLHVFDYPTGGVQLSLQSQLESVFGSIPENTRAYFSVRFRRPDGRISAPHNFSVLAGESYTYTAP